jgi:hypothetical protein
VTATRFILSLTAAAFVMHAADVRAQGAFPAPLPGQAAAPAASPFPPVGAAPATSPFPPVNGATAAPARPAPSPSAFSTGAPPVGGGAFGGAPQQQAGPPPGAEECQSGFMPLRADAEAKAKAIQAAGKRKAPPAEACKLIGNFAQAETRMINFVEANSKKCGIPPEVAAQRKKGHANTSQLQTKVCAAAAGGGPAGPAGPSLSEVLGSASLPEAKPSKKGGSTFDTLNGNVLTR